jgi:hypothetical protein
MQTGMRHTYFATMYHDEARDPIRAASR